MDRRKIGLLVVAWGMAVPVGLVLAWYCFLEANYTAAMVFSVFAVVGAVKTVLTLLRLDSPP